MGPPRRSRGAATAALGRGRGGLRRAPPPRVSPAVEEATPSPAPVVPIPNTPSVPVMNSTPRTNTPQLGGMTVESRYNHNLKVLRRRDPTIQTIFDQFSHVCLYHHNGQKWEKNGYEGSMFLFEREQYPRYGFYILNRMGMDDYIQPIYPEDDIEIHGHYLMYRSYPGYTANRRAQMAAGTPPFVDFADPNAPVHTEKKEGRSVTIGLWMFATDSRESLTDVMMRLHSYIVRNQSYPEEFRYGPDRPALLRTTALKPAEPYNQGHKPTGSDAINSPARILALPTTHSNNGGLSELDKLFSKLSPSENASPVPTHRANGSSISSSMQGLFSTLAGPGASAPRGGSPAPAAAAAAQVPIRGRDLLNSIFASASPGLSASQSTPAFLHQAPTQREGEMNTSFRFPPPAGAPRAQGPYNQDPAAHAAQPSASSASFPVMYDKHAFASLLGLSAAAATTSASHSSSTVSRVRGDMQYQYEEDTEDSSDGRGASGASDADYSEGSTVIDTDTGAEARGPVQSRARPGSANASSVRRAGTTGDMTPRPALRGFKSATPPLTGEPFAVPSASRSAPSVIPGPKAAPFEDTSELWPTPLDDRSGELDAEAEEEVVELDFEDTIALSDPAVFAERSRGKGKGKKAKEEGRGKRGKKGRTAEAEAASATASPAIVAAAPAVNGHAKGKKKQGDLAQPEVTQSGGEPIIDGKVPALAGHPKSLNGNGNGAVAYPFNGNLAREALLAVALAPSNSAVKANGSTVAPSLVPGGLSKNDFVRELLTLVHTNKAFVERLWLEYRARSE